MSNHILTATFEVRSEAERAHTQLRSAGVPDSAVTITGAHDGETGTRDDEVGVPDSSGSLSDLQGSPSDEPGHDGADGVHTPLVTLTVDLTGLSADPHRINDIFLAAGGRPA